ncbi:protein kinase [Nocardia elegans]|uniref:Protein kinase n=1 Tax=Nocardia elegans TaxID=300029 RepID=A0ABW6TQQ0_9NOCA|nr:protein kinase [Nocardia elegans]MBF6446603.1 protein kinase [Nocardia elegans]
MTRIGHYDLITEFTTAGGGQCRWAFASKDGHEYFLKEFLNPTYPLADSPGSAATKARKMERCIKFEQHQQRIIAALEPLSKPGGNLVVTRDFFREGARYYKATDKIDVSSVSVDRVHTLSRRHQAILATTVAHSVQILHRIGLVHGDIKPPNVLLKETKRAHFAAKLIDFDDAFFSGEPTARGEVVGDIVYYSPELYRYITGDAPAADITLASDIFALGILFTEYFAGRRPQFGAAETCALGALDREPLTSGVESRWPEMHYLLQQMLDVDYQKRPTIDTVIVQLKSLRDGRTIVDPIAGPAAASGSSARDKASEATRAPESRLRGSLVSRPETVRPCDAEKPRLRGSLINNSRKRDD